MKVRLQSLPYGLRLLLATLSLGIGTGLVGIACHYLLEGVQELAFGQASSDLLQQFQEAGGLRRFLVLCVTGCLAAGFWYVLQKRYQILSIRQQIDLAGDRDPTPFAHLLHAGMQVAIVGAGASVGKEGAPREVGALLAGRLAKGLLVYLLLRNGAYGGTLTPSFALGIGSGYLVTLLLTVLGIHLDPALGMLLGATVFLGTTLEAPLTAIALSLGFTGQTWNLTIPLVLAAGLSYVIRKRWEKK